MSAETDVKTVAPSAAISSSWRLYAVIAGLYLMQGIPIYLFAAALPTILRTQGVSLTAIGGLGLLLLPSLLKFLWAPYVDRFSLFPIGRRRSWIVPTQAAIVGLIVVLSGVSPTTESLGLILGITMVVAILSATQDIATDGFATERLAPHQRAFGNSLQAVCVALGVFIGNGGTLLVYGAAGWETALLVIAGVAALATIPVVFMAEDSATDEVSSTRSARPSVMAFLRRPEARQILIFALLYRCSEGLVKAMEQPFLVDNGLSVKAIGLLSGVSAATVGIAASLLAVPLIGGLGLYRFLWLLGIVRTIYFLWFAAYAVFSPDMPTVLLGAVLLDKIVRQMEIVGLYALFMGASSRSQAGTDFTILSSASLVVFMVGSMASGAVADHLGYASLFGASALISGICLAVAMSRLPRTGVIGHPQSGTA